GGPGRSCTANESPTPGHGYGWQRGRNCRPESPEETSIAALASSQQCSRAQGTGDRPGTGCAQGIRRAGAPFENYPATVESSHAYISAWWPGSCGPAIPARCEYRLPCPACASQSCGVSCVGWFAGPGQWPEGIFPVVGPRFGWSTVCH